MSFFATLEADIAAIEAKFAGSAIGSALKADYEACLAALETIGVADLEASVKAIGVAALGGLATGGTAGAIAAGIAAAETQAPLVEKQIANAEITTLVSTITNQVSAIPAVAASSASGTSAPAA